MSSPTSLLPLLAPQPFDPILHHPYASFIPWPVLVGNASWRRMDAREV